MRTRIPTSIPCTLLLAGIAQATPNWDRFEDIPGAKAVQQAQANLDACSFCHALPKSIDHRAFLPSPPESFK